MAEQTGPVWYKIRVRGLLGKTLLGAFPGMCARAHEKETVLCGPVADQAALHGVLTADLALRPGALRDPCQGSHRLPAPAYQIVPDGQESSHIDIDAELNDLLRQAS